MTTPPPPAWYSDPVTPGWERWWTGQDWSEHVQQAPSAPMPPPLMSPPIEHVQPAAMLQPTASVLPSTPRGRSLQPPSLAVVGIAAAVTLAALGGYLFLGNSSHASLAAAPVVTPAAAAPTLAAPTHGTPTHPAPQAASSSLLGRAALSAAVSRANLQPADAHPGFSVVAIHQDPPPTLTGPGHCSDSPAKPAGLRADSYRGIDNASGQDTGVHEDVSGFDTPAHAAAVLTEERRQDTSGCVDHTVLTSGGHTVSLRLIRHDEHSQGLTTDDARATIIELEGSTDVYVTTVEQHIGQFVLTSSAVTRDEPTNDDLAVLRGLALVAARRLPIATI